MLQPIIYKDLKHLAHAADRNRTGTGITTHGILSHLVPTDFPRTSWYEMELRVPKMGVFYRLETA